MQVSVQYYYTHLALMTLLTNIPDAKSGSEWAGSHSLHHFCYWDRVKRKQQKWPDPRPPGVVTASPEMVSPQLTEFVRSVEAYTGIQLSKRGLVWFVFKTVNPTFDTQSWKNSDLWNSSFYLETILFSIPTSKNYLTGLSPHPHHKRMGTCFSSCFVVFSDTEQFQLLHKKPQYLNGQQWHLVAC